MNIIEVSELLKENKKVRRKSWQEGYILYLTSGNNIMKGWKMFSDYYILNIEDALANDWEEYVREEPNEKIENDLLERIEKSKLLKEAENKLKK